MQKYPTLAALLAAFFLYGCSAPSNIQPHNQVAEKSLLKNSNSLKNRSLPASPWPTTNWWAALEDPQLNQLIEEALKHSPNIELADAALAKASSVVMAADGQFDPALSAEASLARARISRSQDYTYRGNRYGTMRNMGLNLNYSFDLWGGERAAWESSVSNQKALEIDHQAAKITLSTSIVYTYIQLANAYSLEDLAKKDQKRNDRIVSITQNLLDHGLTSEDRLYTALSDAATARQTLKKRALVIKQLQNGLATLIGEGPDKALTIKRPTSKMATLLCLPEDIPANLLAHRPDIMAAKWRIEAMDKQIYVAKTHFYPNLNLSATAGFKAMLGDAIFEDVSRSWSIAPAISLPLFSKGLRADLIGKTADYDTTIGQYNKTLLNALSEVSDNILTLKSIEQQLKDAQKSMTLAEKSYVITEKRYQAGMGSQLELLIANSKLLQSESAFTILKNKQQETQVLLVRSLGGGFNENESASLAPKYNRKGLLE